MITYYFLTIISNTIYKVKTVLNVCVAFFCINTVSFVFSLY